MTRQQLQLQLFGSVSILLDGSSVKHLSTRAAEALVIYVLHQPHPIPRDQLVEMFFRASEPKQGAANLRAMLSQIKKRLDPFIEISRHTVQRRETGRFSVDSLRFSQQASRWLDAGGRERLSIEQLQATLSLYQGDFLAGFYLRDAPDFEQWALIERERLRLLAMDGLQQLIRLQCERVDLRGALVSAEKLLSIEPLLESVHRTKMQLLTRTGQRALALRHFENVKQLFREELDAALSAKTVTLYERIRALPDVIPQNLPANRSEFIGRDAAIETVVQHLAQPTRRLVTLLGMGGIGKTRLSIAVAQRLYEVGMFLDGVYFVSLAMVESAEQFALQIANMLDLTLRGTMTPIQQLCDYLREREVLLILDNFEQLVTEAVLAQLQQLLQAAPELKLLITSRVQLFLNEEILFDLQGLEQGTLDSEAARLFLACARRQQNRFLADEASILTICQLLEGVPLSLELAAALTRHHPCRAIIDNVRESLDVLTTSFYNVPARQRSLRAMFEYSWRLLSAEQQQTFAKVAIFPASFSIAAAEAIADAGAGKLAELQARSLLKATEHERFQLHATLREYAVEYLQNPHQSRNAHAAYYTDALNHLAATAMDKSAFQLVRRELPNLRAAWQWWLQKQDFEQLQRLIQPLFEYFNWSGRGQAGIVLFEEAIAQLPIDQTILRALLKARIGRFYIFTGQLNDAAEVVAAALKVLEMTNLKVECAAAYGYWSMAAFHQGEFGQAQQFAEKGLAYGLSAEDDETIAYNHNLLATAVRAQGQWEKTRFHLQAALAIRREQNDQLGVGILLNNLGNLLIDNAEYEPAFDHLKEAARIFHVLEHAHGEATALSNAAVAAGRLERYIESERLQRASLEIKQTLGNKRSIALSLAMLADAYVAQGKIEDAESCLRAALNTALAVDATVALDEVFVSAAELFMVTERADVAAIVFDFLANSPKTREAVLERVSAVRTEATISAESPTRASVIELLQRHFSQ